MTNPFRLLQHLVRKMYGDSTPDLETWCFKNSKIATADGIIAAAIIESLAKNFDDWTLTSTQSNRGTYYRDHKLKNTKKKIEVFYNENWHYSIRDNYKVNGVDITNESGNEIVDAYNKINTERVRLKTIADKALAEQQRLEKAWNLAENLLGMKRNEHGALVPIVTVSAEETVNG